MKKAFEVNFDGLVGPTHNYAGLSHGNVASMSHKSLVSNPREAVLQGLRKAKSLADLGLKQAFLPPQDRPFIPALRRAGFTGKDEAIIARAAVEAPELLSAVTSASCMWTANAATVSPSADTADSRVHFTPANLTAKFHRSIEVGATGDALRAIFADAAHFVHHAPLPATQAFGDEGAANHTRLCAEYGGPGLEFFVYGRRGIHSDGVEPKKYPARHTWEASTSIARLHGLGSDAVVYGQQNPAAIDAGVFHNDVAGVGNGSVYFYHEHSFHDTNRVIGELQEKFQRRCGRTLRCVMVPAAEVSLEDAVKSYLFNSQLISFSASGMALVLPEECKSTPAVAKYLEKGLGFVQQLLYFDLRQSMRNGGGPACLRLRVVLTEEEIKAVGARVFLDESLYKDLMAWATKHYRESIAPEDLADPKLLQESRAALDELTKIMKLGSLYAFQKP
jgi:succinylarginine dihydrolase